MHNQLIPDNFKTCPLWMNLGNSEKEIVAARKMLVLKSCRILDISLRILHSSNRKIGFSFATCLNPWKNHYAGKRNDMFVIRNNNLTENSHVIMQKDVRYLVNKLNHNTSLVVSSFLWR